MLQAEAAERQIPLPELDEIMNQLNNNETYPDEDEGGGAGFTDLSAGGAASAPRSTACAAADDSTPSFTPLLCFRGHRRGVPQPRGHERRRRCRRRSGPAAPAVGDATHPPRVRRAMRGTAGAQLLAFVRAASAQQQQQPGAMSLAQLKEELKDLRAWLGL